MSIKRGLFYSFGRTGADFLLQFFSNVVLARLLLPSEIGIFSVAVAVTALLHSLRDFGVGRYLIQERELTDDKVRTVFGVTMAVGFGLAGLIFFSRHAVAHFYAEPQIEGILALLSINFLMLPFGQPALVLMRRELRYGRVAVITLAAGAAGAATSIIFAALNCGPFALAYGALVNNGLIVTLSLLSRPDHIFLRPSFCEWRSVCKFGGVASAGTIIVQFGMQAPELLLGRLLGFSAVGLYSRGIGIARIVEQFFVNAISWVTGAEFGSLYRSERSLSELVLRATDLTLVVGWPALIFLALKAEALIWLLYGEKWLPVVPLVQALCLARGVHLIVAQAPAIYEGTGAVGLQLRNEIVLQAISIGLLFVGSLHSLEAVAWLRLPLGLAVVLVHLSVFRRYAAIGLAQMCSVIRTPALMAMLFGAALAGLISLEPAGMSHDPWALLIEAAIMAVLYLIMIALIPNPLAERFRTLLWLCVPRVLELERLWKR